MELVKKNLVSIVCGAVSLLAMGFVFYPMGGFYGDLQAKLDGSQSTYIQITALNHLLHNLPALNPGETTGAPLEGFPNPPTIKVGEAAVGKLHEQAELILKQAMDMNRHRELTPITATSGAAFKRLYHDTLEQFKKAMNATMPPTAQDLKNEELRLWNEDYAPRIHRVGGQDLNSQNVTAEYNQKKLELPEEIKQRRAKQFTMYVSSEKTLDVHPLIPRMATGSLPEVIDMWAAQLGLWIAQDIVGAIMETNAQAGGRTVETAAVKRLVKLEIPKRYITAAGELPFAGEGSPFGPGGMMGMGGMPSMPGMPGGGMPGQVVAPMLPEIDGVPKEFKHSPTGRVCNKLYDVMHFTVVVDTDTNKFREFMANLEKNRFITILRIDLAAVDRDKEQQRGYVYGANPVVRLSLRCEAVFFRSWTKPLMPQNIRTMLSIPAYELAPAVAGK
jgi:hypothetical protein